MRRAGRSAFIAGGLVLLLVGVAPAQVGGSGSGGGSSGGGFTGGSSGSGGGGSPGGGGSSGGSAGNSGGGFTGSAGGAGASSSNSTSIGATSPLGRYYGNPIANRLSPAGSTSGKFVITPSVYPTSYAAGFGTPAFNAATLSRSPTQGATGIGTQGAAGTTPFAGATSAGIRRAPGYVTEAVFDSPARPTLEAIRPELQSVLSRASRLPSRDRIRVVTDGDTVVLRGQVRDERERRLAEAMIRLSPGVRLVRNELEPLNKP